MKLARGRVTPSTGADARKLGAKCNECPLQGQRVVLPQTRKNAQMILLGESPGKVEEYEGRPFAGPTGQWVDECLNDLGIARGKLHVTNAILCRPKPKMSPGDWKEAISCCAPRLERELKSTRARFIFACGKAALQATTGIGKIAPWIGAPLVPEAPKVPKKSKKKILYRADYSKFQVLPTLHPTFCRYRSPAYQPVYARHLQRAWLLATKQLKPWKWPKIVVEVGQEMIDALESILASPLPIGVDVETAGDDPVQANLLCVGFANRNIAVSVPWPLDVYPHHGPRLRQLIEEILDSPNEKVLQNGKHDEISLSVHNLPLRNFSFDTMLAHAVIAPELPHDLGFITALEYHAPRHKSEFHVESDAKGMAKFTKADPFKLRTYNAKDAFVQVIDADALRPQVEAMHRGPQLLAEYMALARVGMKMQWRGIRVDPRKFKRHRKALRQRKKAALYDLRKIAKAVGIDDLNPNSNRLIKALFFEKLGIRPRRYSEKTNAPKLDEEELQHLLTSENIAASLAARALLRYRRWSKLLSVYIERLPTKKSRNNLYVRSTWRVHGTVTGRWSSAKPNVQNIPRPRKIKQEGRTIELPGLRDIFCARDGMYLTEADYCVDPNTKILTTDLRWVPAGTLKKGDRLIGFPENFSVRPHTFKPAKVLGTSRIIRTSYRIVTDRGSTIVSADHRMARCRKNGHSTAKPREWVEAQHLHVGDSLSFFTEPWEEDCSWDGGWLAGFFDGEGYVSNNGVGLGQNPGALLERAKRLLTERGLAFGLSTNKNGCVRLHLKGNAAGTRLLGSIRPQRLLAKAGQAWNGRRTWGKRNTPARILRIEYLGKRQVVALKTSTGTFVGDGFLHHNSQLELRIIALLAGDKKLLEWYAKGEDVHWLNAKDLFETEAPTDQERDLAKRMVYGLNYGAEAETVWKSLVVDFPDLELELVERLRSKWFATHPDIVRWQQTQLRSAREKCYVEEPISGRREYIWGEIEPTKIYNFPIQGAAASIINPACLALAEELDFKNESLLLQVHDALVVEGPDPIRLYRLLKKHMERTVVLNGKKVTFPVDFKCGQGTGLRSSWGELKKVKSLKKLEAAWQRRKRRDI